MIDNGDKTKTNILTKIIDFIKKIFFSTKNKKKEKEEKLSKTDDIYPLW